MSVGFSSRCEKCFTGIYHSPVPVTSLCGKPSLLRRGLGEVNAIQVRTVIFLEALINQSGEA